jgi:hypothetical protein
MNPYAIVSSIIGTAEAASLRARLMAWHDAMVAHERRLRLGPAIDMCDEECPHAEARALWAEASVLLGKRVSELTFLRSRAQGASAQRSRGTRTASAPAKSQSIAESPRLSPTAGAEL